MDEIMGQALWGKVGRLEEAQAAGGSGYAETDKKVIYPAKTLDFVQSDEIGYGVVMLDAPLNFANGDTVIVKWDGTECRCLGYVYDGGFSGFGNLGASEGEGTGEPFAYESSDGMAALIAFEPGQHTVAIYTEAETIHTIDPKFLPTVEIDLDALGITEKIFALAASGGGFDRLYYQMDDILDKIKDGNVMCAMTFPVGEIAYRVFVNPMYVSMNPNGTVEAIILQTTSKMSADTWTRMSIQIQVGTKYETGRDIGIHVLVEAITTA